jgi:flagellar assembly protein FliH
MVPIRAAHRHDSHSVCPDPINSTSTSAAQEAEAIVQQAREQAEHLLQTARREAAQIREDAVREGYAEGQAQGRAECAADREHVRGLIDAAGAAYQRFCLDQTPALVALATQIAEKLLLEQLSLEPQRVVVLVRHALEHLSASSHIVVHLHPEDLPLVRPHLTLAEADEGAATSPSVAASRQSPPVHLRADTTVERGGCWIESDQGEVEATLSGRLERLEQSLREVA